MGKIAQHTFFYTLIKATYLQEKKTEFNIRRVLFGES